MAAIWSTVRPGMDQPVLPEIRQIQDPCTHDFFVLSPNRQNGKRRIRSRRQDLGGYSRPRPAEQAERPVREERSRDSYRDEYLRNRQNPPASDPRTFPQDSRTRTRPDRLHNPDRHPGAKANPVVRSKRFRIDEIVRTSVRAIRVHPPRQETPRQTFERPSRDNSNSGGNSDSQRRYSNSVVAAAPGKSGRGGNQ
ncbi:MAG: hypothetical protein IPJ06_13960 [Saprospiraceae bacterium]|nr:hypothetical protein [Saprospiraceae bacterium]